MPGASAPRRIFGAVPWPRQSALRRSVPAASPWAVLVLLAFALLNAPAAPALEASPGPEAEAPSAAGVLVVTPSVAFSAARSECGGAAWSGGTVATQWLLDGVPIPGATATVFTAPRADDGHRLACTQTASEGSRSRAVTSAAHTIHEQPPQPAWPISPAAEQCTAAVCMQEGAGPGAIGESYAQDGSWWAAHQVRCVSAPWTSIVGDSSQPTVRPLTEAHEVGISLQRVTAAGTETVTTMSLGGLEAARDELDGAESPFAGQIVTSFGSQPFAAGELWSRRFPSAVGHPDWMVAGGSLLSYALTGTAARSFQLTYSLSAADAGSRLRCVASAADGPAETPTSATFASPEYSVASSAACRPRRIAGLTAPQPAVIPIGDVGCLAAPSSMPAIGAGFEAIAVKHLRIALALSCGLRGGCRGPLVLSAGHTVLARGRLRLGQGTGQVVELALHGPAGRLLARSGGQGLTAVLRLQTGGAERLLATARLLARS